MTADPTPAAPTPTRTGDRRGDLVVLGGYGATGSAVARKLAQWFPGRVVVAGRDLDRARRLAGAVPGLRARRVDVGRPDEVAGAVRGAAVAVMCVERDNDAVARACLERGVHYVDICATTAVLERIEDLHDLAVEHGVTAALSVGLAPGLTNLLARWCTQELPGAAGVDLTVLLGGAGDHGVDSVRWTVRHLAERAPRAGRRVLLAGAGRRTAHPFPFSDQHHLVEALGVPVTTRLCLDSPALTTALFGLRAAGFFALVRRLGLEEALIGALSRVAIGSDRWVLHAEAVTAGGERCRAAAYGRGECAATALVAAHVVRHLGAGAAPAGVHHLDRLTEPAAFLDGLSTRGIAVSPPRRVAPGPVRRRGARTP